MRPLDVVIWGWKDLGFFWGSVGHVMIAEAATTNVLLSQFPHTVGQPSVPRGPNTLFSFSDTEAEEARPAGVVFRVTVPDESSFDAMAANHRARPIWDWDPTPPMQTHCARAAYDALRAGSVPIDSENRYVITPGHTRQIIPDTIWALLKSVPEVAVISQTATELPESERVPYEADISRYVPYSSWHKQYLNK